MHHLFGEQSGALEVTRECESLGLRSGPGFCIHSLCSVTRVTIRLQLHLLFCYSDYQNSLLPSEAPQLESYAAWPPLILYAAIVIIIYGMRKVKTQKKNDHLSQTSTERARDTARVCSSAFIMYTVDKSSMEICVFLLVRQFFKTSRKINTKQSIFSHRLGGSFLASNQICCPLAK